jgi:hypothetical protein
MDFVQKIKVAVDITDGIGSHKDPLIMAQGGLHAPLAANPRICSLPRGIFAPR